MALYYWDLGFDFNSVQQAIANQFFLQTGFVSMESTGRVPTTAVNLDPGDTIAFNAFNVTNTDSSPDNSSSLTSLSITFQNADSPSGSASPFNDGRVTAGSITNTAIFNSGDLGQTTQMSPSIIFSGGSQPLVQFPVWNVVPGTSPLECVTAGRYLMYISLTVDGPNGVQTFVTDPEMIIGGVG